MYLPPKPHVNVGWSLTPFFFHLDPFAFSLAAQATFGIDLRDQEVAFPTGRCYSNKKDEKIPARVPTAPELL